MGEMQWRLVGDVETLRQTPCRRLRCVSSPTRGHQSLTQPTDLVLVYVSKLDKFFVLDGICAHVGMSVSFSKAMSTRLPEDVNSPSPVYRI